MKMKKLTSIALAAALAIGTFGFSVPAKATEPTTTTTDYVLTIPATLSVKNAGWNATDGIKADNSSNNFDTGKKLSVTATSGHGWKLKADGVTDTVGYNLAASGDNSPTYSGTAEPASWEFSAGELNEASGTNKAMGIIVEDYSNKAAGNYTDTVTFTASVEDARQLYSFTLTGPYTGDTLVVEYYEGDTWNDMVAKYSKLKITSNYIGFGSAGMIYKNGRDWVLTTDTVDPNATYTIE